MFSYEKIYGVYWWSNSISLFNYFYNVSDCYVFYIIKVIDELSRKAR